MVIVIIAHMEEDIYQIELEQYFDEQFSIDGILFERHYTFILPDDFSLDCKRDLSWSSSSEDGELDSDSNDNENHLFCADKYSLCENIAINYVCESLDLELYNSFKAAFRPLGWYLL